MSKERKTLSAGDIARLIANCPSEIQALELRYQDCDCGRDPHPVYGLEVACGSDGHMYLRPGDSQTSHDLKRCFDKVGRKIDADNAAFRKAVETGVLVLHPQDDWLNPDGLVGWMVGAPGEFVPEYDLHKDCELREALYRKHFLGDTRIYDIGLCGHTVPEPYVCTDVKVSYCTAKIEDTIRGSRRIPTHEVQWSVSVKYTLDASSKFAAQGRFVEEYHVGPPSVVEEYKFTLKHLQERLYPSPLTGRMVDAETFHKDMSVHSASLGFCPCYQSEHPRCRTLYFTVVDLKEFAEGLLERLQRFLGLVLTPSVQAAMLDELSNTFYPHMKGLRIIDALELRSLVHANLLGDYGIISLCDNALAAPYHVLVSPLSPICKEWASRTRENVIKEIRDDETGR